MKNERDALKIRIIFVSVIFVLFYGVIFSRAFQLQIIEGESLEEKAGRQHVRTHTVPSKRGAILDRNLNELAVSLEVDSIFAHPREMEDNSIDKVSVAKILSEVLPVKKSILSKSLSSKKGFVWLKRQLDLGAEDRTTLSGLKGIGMVKEGRRFYPSDSLAANLMGFTGIDSNGLEGIELHFDEDLKGTPIVMKADKDAKGNLLLFEDLEESVQGMDLVLTIDKNIQYIAEKALKDAVDKFEAVAGTVIVMEPKSGEILAMATLPTFNPNEFSEHSPYEWRNRAVTDSFEPGSTMKAFLLASVLEDGLFDTDDILYCENGKYDVYDRTFHDTKEHGWLSVGNIIKNSSNIGAIKMSEKLGRRRFHSYLKDFGFGYKTGIGLPGESKGVMAQGKKWSEIKRNTISFGQGISVTSIQLVTAISAIANGGYLMEPRIVKELRTSSGIVASKYNPLVRRRVISEETSKEVTEVLKSVVAPGGTGVRASEGLGFAVAGKTGTAQKVDPEKGGYSKDNFLVSFLGFAPADDPRLAIFVMLDEPKTGVAGGIAAAPVFREIVKETLPYLGVFPEGLPSEEVLGEATPRFVKRDTVDGSRSVKKADSGTVDATSTDTVPDFTGKTMRSALLLARVRSMDIDIEGSGRAVSQSLVAGSKIGDGNVTVVFH